MNLYSLLSSTSLRSISHSRSCFTDRLRSPIADRWSSIFIARCFPLAIQESRLLLFWSTIQLRRLLFYDHWFLCVSYIVACVSWFLQTRTEGQDEAELSLSSASLKSLALPRTSYWRLRWFLLLVHDCIEDCIRRLPMRVCCAQFQLSDLDFDFD